MRRGIAKIGSVASRTTRQFYYSTFPDRELISGIEQSPGELSIEPINICNANCIFCGYQYQERARQRMSEEIFIRAIGDYADMNGGNLYWTVVVGDPLLDTDCVERIRYSRSFSCIKRIETITNGINLHRIGVEKLLTSGLNVITFSTTGFDAAMYQRIYRNGKYEQMKENLLTLLRTNRALGRPVRIAIELRIDGPVENILNSSGFQEVIELADSVDSNYYFDNWCGKVKARDLTGNMKLRRNGFLAIKKRIPCGQLWVGAGVLVDGTVTACSCRDLNGDSDLVLGKIDQTPLRELYHSESLRKLRDNWFAGEGMPKICSDCTFYYPYTYLMLAEFRKRHFSDVHRESNIPS